MYGGGDICLVKNDKNEIFYTVDLYAGYNSLNLKHIYYDLDTIDFNNLENLIVDKKSNYDETHNFTKYDLIEEDYTFSIFVKYILLTLNQSGEYGDDYLTITYNKDKNMYIISGFISWCQGDDKNKSAISITKNLSHIKIKDSFYLNNIKNKFKNHNNDPDRLFEFD